MVNEKVLSLICKVLDKKMSRYLRPMQPIDFLLFTSKDGTSKTDIGTVSFPCYIELRDRNYHFKKGKDYSMIYIDLKGSRYNTSIKPNLFIRRPFIDDKVFDSLIDSKLCDGIYKKLSEQNVVRREFYNVIPAPEFRSQDSNIDILPIAFLRNDALLFYVTGGGGISGWKLNKLKIDQPKKHKGINYLDMNSFVSLELTGSSSFQNSPMGYLDYEHDYSVDFSLLKNIL